MNLVVVSITWIKKLCLNAYNTSVESVRSSREA